MARRAKVPRDRSEAEPSAPPHELLGEEVDALAALEVLFSIVAVDAKGRQTLLQDDVVAAAGRIALQVLDDLGDEALHGVRVLSSEMTGWHCFTMTRCRSLDRATGTASSPASLRTR